MRVSERLARLEQAARSTRAALRIVQHVLNCAPADRAARLAAIKASDLGAFHIVRVVVRPGEQALAE
jgi:hypothetical protein